MNVKLTINGVRIESPPGESVLDAANANGIPVPSLCHHRELAPVGSCRLCMVEVDGFRTEVAACALKVAEGMVVRTETPRIAATRKVVLGMLLARYRDAAGVGAAAPTEFMHWVRHYGAEAPSDTGASALPPRRQRPAPADSRRPEQMHPVHPLRARLRRGAGALRMGRRRPRRARSHRRRHGIRRCSMRDANPAAPALHSAPPARSRTACRRTPAQPDRLVTTTCAYCGVGCNFDLNVKDESIVGVTSNPYAPVNGMHLCVKGRYGYDFVHHADRLLKPRVRRYVLDGTRARPAPGADRGWRRTGTRRSTSSRAAWSR